MPPSNLKHTILRLARSITKAMCFRLVKHRTKHMDKAAGLSWYFVHFLVTAWNSVRRKWPKSPKMLGWYPVIMQSRYDVEYLVTRSTWSGQQNHQKSRYYLPNTSAAGSYKQFERFTSTKITLAQVLSGWIGNKNEQRTKKCIFWFAANLINVVEMITDLCHVILERHESENNWLQKGADRGQ